MQDNPYMMLAKVFLPSEMTEYFDLTDVRTDEYGGEPRVHIFLDEKEVAPEVCPDASPNGFYEESCMNHFPINEYRSIHPRLRPDRSRNHITSRLMSSDVPTKII